MARLVAAVLVLLFASGEAHAYCRVGEQHFLKHRQLGRHIDDEAIGDEFKRHRENVLCRWEYRRPELA